MAGALAAARAGRWQDQGRGQRTTAAALVLLIVAWLPLAAAATATSASLLVLGLGIVVLDLAVQALHVTNQGMVLRGDPATHSRLVGCYMLFYAVGSGVGALGGTAAHAAGGWSAVCVLGGAIGIVALVFWAAASAQLRRAV